MKKITRVVTELRGIDTEEKTAEFVISTESIDRHGTVFKMDGWDLSVYERNPIVCYNHDSSGSNPDTIIGTSEVYKDGNSLIGKVRFEEGNPLAEKICNKIEKGILKMASVGARVHDYRWGNPDEGEDSGTIYFTRQELLEWSVVSVGSNPDAFKRSADEIDAIKEELAPKGVDGKTASRLNKLKLKKLRLKHK